MKYFASILLATAMSSQAHAQQHLGGNINATERGADNLDWHWTDWVPDWDDEEFEWEWAEAVTAKCTIGEPWNDAGTLWGRVVLFQPGSWSNKQPEVKINARFNNLSEDSFYYIDIYDNDTESGTCDGASNLLVELGDFEARRRGRGRLWDWSDEICLRENETQEEGALISAMGKHVVLSDDLGAIGCCTIACWGWDCDADEDGDSSGSSDEESDSSDGYDSSEDDDDMSGESTDEDDISPSEDEGDGDEEGDGDGDEGDDTPTPDEGDEGDGDGDDETPTPDEGDGDDETPTPDEGDDD